MITPVSAPTEVSRTATSVTLAWTPVAGAVGYRIEYIVVTDEPNWNNPQTVTVTNGTSTTILGLTADTLYQFRIVAIGNAVAGNHSTASDPIDVRTAELPSTIPAPERITGRVTSPATGNTTSSVTLSWAHNAANVNYVITPTNAPRGSAMPTQGQISAVTISGNIASVTITGLDANKTYRFTIAGQNANGDVSQTVNASAKTLRAAFSAAARAVAPHTIGLNSATVNWNAVSTELGSSVRYIITVWQGRNEVTSSVHIGDVTTSIETDNRNREFNIASVSVTGLDAGTRYQIRISIEVDGEFINVNRQNNAVTTNINITTARAQPASVRFDKTSAKLTWNAPNARQITAGETEAGKLSHYEIYVRTDRTALVIDGLADPIATFGQQAGETLLDRGNALTLDFLGELNLPARYQLQVVAVFEKDGVLQRSQEGRVNVR
jgi:hypothetical protein